jgi:hypothetical protein
MMIIIMSNKTLPLAAGGGRDHDRHLDLRPDLSGFIDVIVDGQISSSSRNSNSGVWGERVVTFRRATRARQ